MNKSKIKVQTFVPNWKNKKRPSAAMINVTKTKNVTASVTFNKKLTF